MAGDENDIERVAEVLQASLGPLFRRMRQVRFDGDLTLAEGWALSRLDRDGPATSAALARQEQITPQSMGVTLSALEERGLVSRRRDPDDGRSVVVFVTRAGREALRHKRSARTEQMATALSSGFTSRELKQLMAAAPLIERLASAI